MSLPPHKLYLNQQEIFINDSPVKGEFVRINGESYYKISNYQKMPPFFMTLVSPADHWLYISSKGGLTAGRKNAENALFPYYTDDKITDLSYISGGKSVFRVKKGAKEFLWEPLLDKTPFYQSENYLYKNKLGNKLRFEEKNLSLGLTYTCEWSFAREYGFIYRHWLQNNTKEDMQISLLSGLQNILPAGLSSQIQNSQSTLVDAYKKAELIEPGNLALYYLSSNITDRAEPSESLRTNVVWSRGLKNPVYLLSTKQLSDFYEGRSVHSETEKKGIKAAYFVVADIKLPPGQTESWDLIADVDLNISNVLDLQYKIDQESGNGHILDEAIAEESKDLWNLVALADGNQLALDRLSTSRHFSNVLYNIMRGGVFEHQYEVRSHELKVYIRQKNIRLVDKHSSFLNSLSDTHHCEDLMDAVRAQKDPELERVCTEYLPLTFSRRHGDPSRPWNKFNIAGLNEKEERNISYEGNWRDIFQNWEALAYSFPTYIGGMISRFLNASTVDGYNPYRLTLYKMDWEIIEPDDPWSFIGYWGDHQLIYLLRLLEHAERHYPGKLLEELDQRKYVYADVPYRLKPWAAMMENPRETIIFDEDLHLKVIERVKEIGTDGQQVWYRGELLKASLLEKLLLTLAVKFSSFVPEGGVWMNTQRPEWNDANNALVGNGLSMVTLYYMRRYIEFLQHLLLDVEKSELYLNRSLMVFLEKLSDICVQFEENISSGFKGSSRFEMMQALGLAGESYRLQAYRYELKERIVVQISFLTDLLNKMQAFCESSMKKNKQENNLYHSYNLLNRKKQKIRIASLNEMLEGQVAVLSTGTLKDIEVDDLLNQLRGSALFRPDQQSFMLYPNRRLPHFLEKNKLSKEFCEQSELLQALDNHQKRELVEKDRLGNYHFKSAFRNARDLDDALELLSESGYEDLVMKEREVWLSQYEEVFNHRAFTGRSGTFFKYEGLGSVYWHMVSKLLLAVQENIFRFFESEENSDLIPKLIDHYYFIRKGIGYGKSPSEYGAFPTDAYSHTPDGAGVQQPGLTGQVKEDILCRWGELGIRVHNGQLHFKPLMLRRQEFRKSEARYTWLGPDKNLRVVDLSEGEMAFTYCGILIRYRLAKQNKLQVKLKDESWTTVEGNALSPSLSRSVFSRKFKVQQVLMEIDDAQLID